MVGDMSPVIKLFRIPNESKEVFIIGQKHGAINLWDQNQN
jgi:hypothetical protein